MSATYVSPPAIAVFTGVNRAKPTMPTPCSLATPPIWLRDISVAVAAIPGAFHQPGRYGECRYPVKAKNAKKGLSRISAVRQPISPT